MQLKFELQTVKKRNLSISYYLQKIKTIGDSLAAAAQPIPKPNLILCILGGLPHEYDSFITSTTTRTDDVFIEDLHAILLNQEVQLTQYTYASFTTEPQANVTNTTLHFNGRGRGRGYGHGRGSGRGRGGPGLSRGSQQSGAPSLLLANLAIIQIIMLHNTADCPPYGCRRDTDHVSTRTFESRALRSLHFVIVLYLSIKLLALAQDENQFIYNGFRGANLHLDGIAQIHPSGLLQLTNTSKQQIGHAFYQLPLKFNTSSSGLPQSLSFSTNFVIAMVPELPTFSGHGIAFTISPSMDFKGAVASHYLGLFNSSNNGLSSNHVVAVELDTLMSAEFEDINDNHVGIDVNSLKSIASAPVTYFSDKEGPNKSLVLISGNPIQVWIDYDEVEKLLNVSIAPAGTPKPNHPLLSTPIDLSLILLDSVYVGFSSATGNVASNHYVLGWSFNRSGEAQRLELSNLPSFPRPRKSRHKLGLEITVSVTASALLTTIIAVAYIVKKKKYEEIREDWEREFGPQRFSYKDLYKATKGFKDKDLLGAGGFGKGMKEFVNEIASMGRLRHRNLVQLLGYCRRRGELLLVYDHMPNGSLDKFLFSNEKPNLNWAQRYRILKGVASGLLYLHEEWEQVVLHRDVKASNVLLDADLNGRLGDFGLARLYDHGANPQTTYVVGTVGYLAPELTKAGKPTTSTDVFAFGAFMLEVACGRRPTELQGLVEEMVLVDWVFERWEKRAILETSDPRLEGDYVAEEMELVLKLGLLCSHPNPAARPSMRQVMQYLDGDAILPEILLDGVGVGMFVMSDEAPAEFVMSFSLTSGKGSAISMSSTDSILRGGR
ncbi:hypothetical protein F0562_021987 [Nyssa sinensis]|uniref:non-specific serine/threonine protein kinase n=1 Tax=Nyssa sinensis TaxID=561372 RepID=A0A5J5BMG3_9ASTE|nr:hypothetical protein F0562_021987 [Nyssa sinensis]